MRLHTQRLLAEATKNQRAIDDITEFLSLVTDEKTYAVFRPMQYVMKSLFDEDFNIEIDPVDWSRRDIDKFIAKINDDSRNQEIIDYVTDSRFSPFNNPFKHNLKCLNVAHAIAHHDGSDYDVEYRELVKDVLRKLHDFVEADMPEEYVTELNKELASHPNLAGNWHSIIIETYRYVVDSESYDVQGLLDNPMIKRSFILYADKLIDTKDEFLSYVDEFIKKNLPPDDVQPEAPDDAPLEKYAFQPRRIDRLPREENTEIETELYDALVKHFTYVKPLPEKFAEMMKEFLKSGQYNKVFHEPNADIVYRGMAVNRDYLAKALKLDDDDKESLEYEGEAKASFTFTPRPGVGATSWTTDINVAKNFWLGHMPGADPHSIWSLIMYARTSDNQNAMLVGEGGLYDVKGFYQHPDEHEVLTLGKVHVYRVQWKRLG